MRKASDPTALLAAMRKKMKTAAPAATAARLVEMAEFGINPGMLRAKIYIPDAAPSHPALVVVLHGCTQTADGYDAGAGWSQLADRHGFVLLFPEQQRQNNPNLCFNWFSPEDSRRDGGEALSIRQMIAAMAARHGVDPARVFVTGLSAGGAMASVMLATYPELFAGGAIIAGLPYGCAATIPQAFDRMRGQDMPGDAALAALVRNASPHRGPWPTISIWHGSGDATVNPSNAAALIGQWRSLHGVAAAPTRLEAVDGYPRRVWCGRDGRELIEEYSITGMGHGTPLDTLADDPCGASGAFMLEASISSTRHICRFWGLTGPDRHAAREAAPAEAPPVRQELVAVGGSARTNRARRLEPEPKVPSGAAGGVGKVIEDALRAAGLMR